MSTIPVRQRRPGGMDLREILTAQAWESARGGKALKADVCSPAKYFIQYDMEKEAHITMRTAYATPPARARAVSGDSALLWMAPPGEGRMRNRARNRASMD